MTVSLIIFSKRSKQLLSACHGPFGVRLCHLSSENRHRRTSSVFYSQTSSLELKTMSLLPVCIVANTGLLPSFSAGSADYSFHSNWNKLNEPLHCEH